MVLRILPDSLQIGVQLRSTIEHPDVVKEIKKDDCHFEG